MSEAMVGVRARVASDGSEVLVTGGSADLVRLAAFVRSGLPIVAWLDVPHIEAAPYAQWLDSVEVRPAEGIPLLIAIEARRLVFAGDAACRDTLAYNFEFLASSEQQPDHLHVEYYSGHPFLDERSVSLVLEVET
jgi:hypothetical protein